MADPIGTALGALGIVGLVSVCLDCFNFISDGRSVGRDFVLLDAQFSALKIRLLAWSIACGFLRPEGYDKRLDEPIWKQHVQKQLNSISLLFLDAAKLIKRYELEDRLHQHTRLVTLGQSTTLVEEGLNDFLKRIKKTKRQAGLAGLFTWALRDKKQFTELNERLGICIEALEQVLRYFDLFGATKRAIQDQVNAISDIESLEEMAGASSNSSGSSVISAAASQRLVILGRGSIVEISTLASDKTDTETFLTARSRFSESSKWDSSGVSPHNDNKDSAQPSDPSSKSNPTDEDISQHARAVIEGPALNQGTIKPISEPSDMLRSAWGTNIRLKKLELANEQSISLPDYVVDQTCVLTLKSLWQLVELAQKEDFFAVIGTSPNLRNIIVAFEGGRDTPYEGGIFYLKIMIPAQYPIMPPKLQLLTKVYHPNIGPDGQICVYGWSAAMNRYANLVVMILALLDDPSVDDPLVPEIATTYLQDREQYTKNARIYTERYAHWEHDIVSKLGLQ